MFKSGIVKSSIIVLVLSNLSNLMQYLAQLFLGRALSHEAFGVFNSINSLAVLVSSLTVAVSYAAAHELIRLSDNRDLQILFIRELLVKSLICSAIVSVVVAALSVFIADYLSLESVLPVIIYILIICGVISQSVFTGVLQGLSRYGSMSLGQAIQMGSRLALIIIAVAVFSFSYNGALFSTFLSYVLVVIFYLYCLRDYLPYAVSPIGSVKGSFRRAMTGVGPMFLTWLYLGIVSNIDIPLVKHFASEYDAGIYSAGAIVGRIVWFVSVSLIYVLFPEVVRSDSSGKSSVGKFLFITMLIFCVSGMIAIIFSLFPELVLSLLFGSKYIDAKDVLIVISFSMVIMAMLTAFYNFCLAKKMTFYIYPAYAILTACIVLINYRFHEKPIEVALVFFGGLVLTFIVNLSQFLIKFRREIGSQIEKVWQDRERIWSTR